MTPVPERTNGLRDTVVYQNRTQTPYQAKDYTKCDVCGIAQEADRLQVMVDNGYQIRNVFCCRRHRYVEVTFNGKPFVQERTDREIEHLANQFRQGQLPEGWE